MGEENWHQARLIPTSGINGADEQERRATSALLAVVGSVHEFGQAVVRPLGAPAGAVETYIEVPFKLGDQTLFPDGLIRVQRGRRRWTALVEVKTGTNLLGGEQIGNYLDIAREQAFDAVLTISNEIPPTAGTHPTSIDRRKLRKVSLHHLAWSQVLYMAQVQKEHRGVADPDQAWILGELIRYLEHPRSGALEFHDMGSNWVTVRESVAAGTLRATDKTIPDVAARWDGLLRFVSLQLGRKLGQDVTPVLSRREQSDPGARLAAIVSALVDKSVLVGAIRVPNAVGPITITADLRASRITCHIDIPAPQAGRPKTRVTWLLRQLADAPPGARVEAFAAHARGASLAETLETVRADPTVLLGDPAKEVRTFRIAMTSTMGAKRGRGRGGFITSIEDAVDEFYGVVAQRLRSWRATPPPIRDVPQSAAEPVGALASTALSSQDGPDRTPVSPFAGGQS